MKIKSFNKNFKFKIKNYLRGFTLIELLIVIAIISALALTIFMVLNPIEMSRRARDTKRQSDIGTLRRAIDLSIANKQKLHPANWININSSTDVTHFDGDNLDLSKYLSVIPEDPVHNTAGGTVQIIGAGCTKASIDKSMINYKYWSDGDTYILRANLESLANCESAQKDGNNNATYELGTDPQLDGI